MLPEAPADRPLTRRRLDAALKEWLERARDGEWIGDRDGRGQRAWIHIRDGRRTYFLNADTRRDGVQEYVGMLALNPGTEWAIVANRNGRMNKVGFGSSGRTITGFYLYVQD